jgi:hypothetical protein
LHYALVSGGRQWKDEIAPIKPEPGFVGAATSPTLTVGLAQLISGPAVEASIIAAHLFADAEHDAASQRIHLDQIFSVGDAHLKNGRRRSAVRAEQYRAAGRCRDPHPGTQA